MGRALGLKTGARLARSRRHTLFASCVGVPVRRRRWHLAAVVARAPGPLRWTGWRGFMNGRRRRLARYSSGERGGDCRPDARHFCPLSLPQTTVDVANTRESPCASTLRDDDGYQSLLQL